MRTSDPDVELRLMILKCTRAICRSILAASNYTYDSEQTVEEFLFPAEEDDE